jgi:hypothetical protein
MTKISYFFTKKVQNFPFFIQKFSFSERFQLKNKHFSKNLLPAALVFALPQVFSAKNFRASRREKTRGTKVIFEKRKNHDIRVPPYVFPQKFGKMLEKNIRGDQGKFLKISGWGPPQTSELVRP